MIGLALALLLAFQADLPDVPAFAFQESLDEDPADPGLSFGPRLGFQRSLDAEGMTLLPGLQARMGLGTFLRLEGAVGYLLEEYRGGDAEITGYPLQVSLLAYPFGTEGWSPYALAGADWVRSRARYSRSLEGLDEEESSDAGFHVGAGLEGRLGPEVTLHLDVRYVILDPDLDGLEDDRFDAIQLVAGLSLPF